MLRIIMTLAGTAMALSIIAPAHTKGATHEYFPGDWEGSEEFAAGEGPCVDWAGTFHEVRSGGYRVVTAANGQVDGEFHVNGVINGHIDLMPDDPSKPAYRGDYVEKVNAIITGYDEEHGDLTRVAQYRLRVPLSGTDGSQFLIRIAGKVTMNANGTTVVSRDDYSCVRR